MHGTTKNKPGPLAPPDRVRPKRNITALSYSFTIFIQHQMLILNCAFVNNVKFGRSREIF